MSKQVLDIEQMNHLKKLGVDTSEASTKEYIISETESYCGYSRSIVIIDGYIEHYIEENKTFTLQDILDLLPNVVISNNKYFKLCIEMSGEKWCIYYYTADTTELISKDDIYLIDAAYEILCWCAENGYLNNKQQ